MDNSKLVYMANQIGKFFTAQGSEDVAVAGIRDHLEKFWEPRMRASITAYLANGGAGLEPNTRKAVEGLKPKVSH